MAKADIYLYNTLSRSKEKLVPIVSGKVGLYTCGPTVYNYAHIGNLRTYVFEDILRRVLEYAGLKVNHVMNITDVGHLTDDADAGEDKMLKGAKREKKTVWEVADFYTQAFFSDMKKLNLLDPSTCPKATDHIKEQLSMIDKLDKNGFVYQAGGNVYFDTSKLSDYGKLAGLDLSAAVKNRVAVDKNKKNVHDFVLWFTKSKFDKQAMKWESRFGVGYPGWHIECSAMSSKYLGKQFDIHCGGIDHISVHHTNEIAQSEGALGVDPWVKIWMHGEFLVIGDSEKMSKSKDNFLTLAVLEEKGYSALDYRYFCLSAHYRKPLKFSFNALDGAKATRKKLQKRVWSLISGGASGVSLEKIGRGNLSEVAISYLESFEAAVYDDLNMPKVVALVWDLLKDNDLSDSEKYALIVSFDSVLGLNLGAEKEKVSVPAEVKVLCEERLEARLAKDWKKSDKLREKVRKLGFDIVDSSNAYEVVVKK